MIFLLQTRVNVKMKTKKCIFGSFLLIYKYIKYCLFNYLLSTKMLYNTNYALAFLRTDALSVHRNQHLISWIKRNVTIRMMTCKFSVSFLFSQKWLLSNSIINSIDFSASMVTLLIISTFFCICIVDNSLGVKVTLFPLLVLFKLTVFMSSLVGGLPFLTKGTLMTVVIVIITFIIGFVIECFCFSSFVFVMGCVESFGCMTFFMTVILFLVLTIFT